MSETASEAGVAQAGEMTPYRFDVPFRDVGLRGEMHSAAYVTYAEEAVSRFWNARAPEAGDPAFCVAKVACSLLKPLHLGDAVEARVKVSKIGGKSAAFAVQMHRGEELAAEAEIGWSACDPQTGSPAQLPEELRDWLYRYLD
jgi:acyl-CoA thioester hydrolase